MNDKKIIIVVGVESAKELSAELRDALLKEHGEDLVIVSQKEANEQGILKGTIPSVSEFKINKIHDFPELKVLKGFDYDHKQECRKGWSKAKRHK